MPFERLSAAPRRIAVIGGGISGMAAAHLLAQDHAVVLFEAEPRLGGHARTVMAGRRGDQPVDTGFIVYNKVNYPHLTELFQKLGVPVTESTMSFGASIGGGRMEYGLASYDAIFAQRRNLFDPRFLGMLRDILRFNAKAADLAQDDSITIGEFLRDLGTGTWFRDRYLLPFSGAIWSTPISGMMDFPAQALVRFFRNHNLLGYYGQHQWYTVQGGSIEYVRRLQAAMEAHGVDLRLGTPVAGVRRGPLGPAVRVHGGQWEPFDEIVFATHSDITLRLLSDPTPEERTALAAVRYQPNHAVLHADESVMPRKPQVLGLVGLCRAGRAAAREDRPDLLDELTPADSAGRPAVRDTELEQPIRDELIYDTYTFDHPVYDMAAFRAQETLRAMNGARDTWFCGAWMRNGFHEDGFQSAVDVVEAMRTRQGLMAA